jgi:DNA polymerase-3 subunit delta'
MVVGEDGTLPLPWLAAPLAAALAQQRGHALLLHATPGVGAMEFALVLAQAWLCEGAGITKPCGRCGSCRLIQSHLHPDLRVLLPETLRRQHGWALADDKADSEDSKKKPSKQIKIDEVRGVIDWVFKTSARGQGKVAVMHPAEALNTQSANALLKTLEEPPPGTRVLLSTADPALMLPTVRSRCQHLRLPTPDQATGVAWLAGQGVRSPELLLAGCSGRPLDALSLSRAGVDAETWASLPKAVAHGRAAALAGWPLPLAIDALHKVCHDAMAHASGAAPRFFPAQSFGPASLAALAAWQDELARVARHDEHPWNEGLLIDALVTAGAHALSAPQPRRPVGARRLDTLSST